MTDKQALDPRRVTWVIDQLREKADDAPGATRRGVMREAADMLAALRQQVETLTQERDELCDWKESALESFEQWHELGDVLLAFVPLTIGDNIPVKLASAIPAEVISLRQQLAALTAAQERLTAKVQARTLRRCAEEIENSMQNPVVSDRELLLNGIAWYRAQADNLDPHAASSPTTKEEKDDQARQSSACPPSATGSPRPQPKGSEQ